MIAPGERTSKGKHVETGGEYLPRPADGSEKVNYKTGQIAVVLNQH
jgi:hypothetical protein